MIKILLTAIIALSVMGCSYRIGDFTMVSTKNMDLSRGADFKRSVTRVKGEDSVPIILGFPIGLPDMKTAIDHAIESTTGAVSLTDAVVKQTTFSFIIFGKISYEVEGTPLIDPNIEKSFGRR